MSEIPSVSVVTTAYNAAAFIETAIRSVLDQHDVTVEYIVVDDGSTDRTAETVHAIGDSRIRLIEAGRVGRGRALNIGLRAARAPFVAIQDADDVSHPGRLAAEMSALSTHTQFAGVGSGQIMIGREEAPSWPSIGGARTVQDVTPHLVFYNPLSHTSLLFRKAALERVGGYNERRSSLYDWDLYIRLAGAGLALGKLPTPLVAKRIHEAQFFEAPNPRRYALQEFRLQCRSLQALRRNWIVGLAFPILLAYRCLPRSWRTFARRQAGRPAIRRAWRGGHAGA